MGERGISYYRQGAVRNLEEDSPEEWVATVLGTEDYTVEVTLEDDKVMDYICDCPYEGDMCKHVVATLLTIRERKKTEKYSRQKRRRVRTVAFLLRQSRLKSTRYLLSQIRSN